MSKTDLTALITITEAQLDLIEWKNSEFGKISNLLEVEFSTLMETTGNFLDKQTFWDLITGNSENVYRIDVFNPWVVKQVETCRVEAQKSFQGILTEFKSITDKVKYFETKNLTFLRQGMNEELVESIPNTLTFENLSPTLVSIFDNSVIGLQVGAATKSTDDSKLYKTIRTLVLGAELNPNSICLQNLLQISIVLSAKSKLEEKYIAPVI